MIGGCHCMCIWWQHPVFCRGEIVKLELDTSIIEVCTRCASLIRSYKLMDKMEALQMSTSSISIDYLEIASSTIAEYRQDGNQQFPAGTLKIPFWIPDAWNNGQGYDYTRLRYWFPQSMTEESVDRLRSLRDVVSEWDDSDDKDGWFAALDGIIYSWEQWINLEVPTPPPFPPPPLEV